MSISGSNGTTASNSILLPLHARDRVSLELSKGRLIELPDLNSGFTSFIGYLVSELPSNSDATFPIDSSNEIDGSDNIFFPDTDGNIDMTRPEPQRPSIIDIRNPFQNPPRPPLPARRPTTSRPPPNQIYDDYEDSSFSSGTRDEVRTFPDDDGGDASVIQFGFGSRARISRRRDRIFQKDRSQPTYRG